LRVSGVERGKAIQSYEFTSIIAGSYDPESTPLAVKGGSVIPSYDPERIIPASQVISPMDSASNQASVSSTRIGLSMFIVSRVGGVKLIQLVSQSKARDDRVQIHAEGRGRGER
jgi:hypothetical protein